MTSCLDNLQIQELIQPLSIKLPGCCNESPIRDVVVDILQCAQSFVPCQAGSLMLSHTELEGGLVFVASFGDGADKLPGTVLPPGKGIAGKVHQSGKPFLTNSPDQIEHFYQEIDKLTEQRTSSLLCVPIRAFGQAVGVLSLLNREGGGFEDKDLALMTIFCQHLTQSIQLMVEAKRQQEAAWRDHLTGLFNDRYIYSYLVGAIDSAVSRGADLSLIFLDMDHFKSVVDTHGHLVGSQALREIGHLIKEVTDQYEGVASRYGGDEYVVAVPEASEEEVLDLAEALRGRIETAVLFCEGEDGTNPVTVKGIITASVGVVSLRQLTTQDRPPELIRQKMLKLADEAMYEAKARGKNRVHWYRSQLSHRD